MVASSLLGDVAATPSLLSNAFCARRHAHTALLPHPTPRYPFAYRTAYRTLPHLPLHTTTARYRYLTCRFTHTTATQHDTPYHRPRLPCQCRILVLLSITVVEPVGLTLPAATCAHCTRGTARHTALPARYPAAYPTCSTFLRFFAALGLWTWDHIPSNS